MATSILNKNNWSIYGTIIFPEVTASSSLYTDLIWSQKQSENFSSKMMPGVQYSIMLITPVQLGSTGGYLYWIKSDIKYTSSTIQTIQIRIRWLYGATSVTPTINVLLTPII